MLRGRRAKMGKKLTSDERKGYSALRRKGGKGGTEVPSRQTRSNPEGGDPRGTTASELGKCKGAGPAKISVNTQKKKTSAGGSMRKLRES